jgi:hypothetical protein
MAMRKSSEQELIADLGRKYIWWSPIGEEPHSEERIIAQVMNLGTYEDIRRLELALGFERLADVMVHAAPGWFSPRSWSFWRRRLALETARVIPAEPPRRAFLGQASVVQDSTDTFVIPTHMPSDFGRVNDPPQTHDGALLVASLEG